MRKLLATVIAAGLVLPGVALAAPAAPGSSWNLTVKNQSSQTVYLYTENDVPKTVNKDSKLLKEVTAGGVYSASIGSGTYDPGYYGARLLVVSPTSGWHAGVPLSNVSDACKGVYPSSANKTLVITDNSNDKGSIVCKFQP